MPFTVNVIDDSLTDGNKTVIFGLANPTNNATIGAVSQYTLTMVDVDTAKISINENTETQTEAIGDINVPVILSRGVKDTTKVQFKLVPGGTTAVEGG